MPSKQPLRVCPVTSIVIVRPATIVVYTMTRAPRTISGAAKTRSAKRESVLCTVHLTTPMRPTSSMTSASKTGNVSRSRRTSSQIFVAQISKLGPGPGCGYNIQKNDSCDHMTYESSSTILGILTDQKQRDDARTSGPCCPSLHIGNPKASSIPATLRMQTHARTTLEPYFLDFRRGQYVLWQLKLYVIHSACRII